MCFAVTFCFAVALVGHRNLGHVNKMQCQSAECKSGFLYLHMFCKYKKLQ